MAKPEFVMEGFDEFRTALRRADLSKELGGVHRDLGAVLAVDAERNKAALEGTYPAYSKVTIKPSAAARQLQIIVGPKKFGYSGEFGRKYQQLFGERTVSAQSMARRVWPPWSSGEGAGHLVFPAIRARGSEIQEMYGAAVEKALRPAFHGRDVP